MTAPVSLVSAIHISCGKPCTREDVNAEIDEILAARVELNDKVAALILVFCVVTPTDTVLVAVVPRFADAGILLFTIKL